jgi:hypothetical protein
VDLVDAIRRVAGGARYVDPELGGDPVVSDAAAPTDPISQRKRDVVMLLALGYTNQEIAAMLSNLRSHSALRTARTSCASSIWRPERSSCSTRSPTGSSARRCASAIAQTLRS